MIKKPAPGWTAKLPAWLRATGKRTQTGPSADQPRKLTPISEVLAAAGREPDAP